MNTDHRLNRCVNHTPKRVALGVLVALTLLTAGPSLGQQDPTENAVKQAPKAKIVRRRLPAHFSAVVSQKQRETIYKVQADYALKMDKLRVQLDALIAERDLEVDAVLDSDQMVEVNKKRTAAKEKRAARSKAKSSAKAKIDS